MSLANSAALLKLARARAAAEQGEMAEALHLYEAAAKMIQDAITCMEIQLPELGDLGGAQTNHARSVGDAAAEDMWASRSPSTR